MTKKKKNNIVIAELNDNIGHNNVVIIGISLCFWMK